MADGPLLLAGDPVEDLEDYIARGGGQGVAAIESMGAALARKEVLLSGLRGRGGGGFRTGRKWEGVVASAGPPRYAVCNGAEGEPGTFKDRALLRHNPYAVLEGLAIGAIAVEAQVAFIATKAAFRTEVDRVRAALADLTDARLLGGVEIRLVEGPDEYLFGEEKALLEVIEGREPLPRLLPPFEHGLFATDVVTGWEAGTTPSRAGAAHPNPTLVNNVETFANVPAILTRGAAWYRTMGTTESPGTLICTVVGDVQRALVVEVEMGTPLSDVIALTGGALDGRTLIAAFSGVANPAILPAQFATPLGYETFTQAGLGLGSAGFVLYDDTACPVDIAREFSRFLYVESCGQCRSCKYGCGEITRHLERVNAGDGTEEDIEVIGERLRTVNDAVRCYLATEEQIVVSSILTHFAEEFALHLEGRCSRPEPRRIVVPKIVDIADGRATFDMQHQRKQPDWTYA
jgi:NADH-quinone oxidoreductase subunit F